jgi:hypothetical protein
MSGPDDEILRRKYLPRRGEAADVGRDSAADSLRERYLGGGDSAPQEEEDLQWGQLREKNARDVTVGRKTILYDKKTGKVKSAQG